MSDRGDEIDDLIEESQGLLDRYKNSDWSPYYRKETETGGWHEGYTGRNGGTIERYWEPGMNRVRTVRDGHIEYGPYPTFGPESSRRPNAR